jgi:hypothetical protein
MGALVAGAVLLFACIVADPPAELPPPPQLPPSIIEGSVYPPYALVMPSWPPQDPGFDVPVQVSDTSQQFVWEVFVDFNEIQSPPPVQTGIERPDPSAYDAGIRQVNFWFPAPDPSSCHKIEFLVALSFNGADPHTPNPPGASSIVWWYNPTTGDISGCPAYDAGLAADGSFPTDAGSDVVVLADGALE